MPIIIKIKILENFSIHGDQIFYFLYLSQNLNPESETFDEGHNNYQEIKSRQQIWEANFR
jgi:hypothetical protein